MMFFLKKDRFRPASFPPEERKRQFACVGTFLPQRVQDAHVQVPDGLQRAADHPAFLLGHVWGDFHFHGVDVGQGVLGVHDRDDVDRDDGVQKDAEHVCGRAVTEDKGTREDRQ